jgi:hypothetical protein
MTPRGSCESVAERVMELSLEDARTIRNTQIREHARQKIHNELQYNRRTEGVVRPWASDPLPTMKYCMTVAGYSGAA